MKNKNNIFWGLILLSIGIIALGNNLDLWNIDIFFDGWWTLFIIIPSIYGFFKKEWISSSLGLAIGILLLLAAQNIIEWNLVGKIFIPFTLVVAGLSFIFKPKTFTVNNSKAQKEYISVFSGNKAKINDKFENTSLVAVFGGIDLDLTNAEIKEDIQIDAVCIFGGIDIKINDKVNIKTNGVPIFGGIENKHNSSEDKSKPTISINYVCIFGGIDLK